MGIIGRRVAEHLRRQGFSAFVWNRTPRPFPNFVGSPAEIAQLTDFIQIFVSDDAALLDIVQQLKMTLKAQHVVMAHCTVAPHTMREAAEIVQRRGAQFLDAPFTGSKMAAEKGELVYYIGGDESAFRRAKPVLEASSKEIIEIGEIGQATTIKIATNMITAATVQVAAEALAVVQSAGMAPEKFAAAMRGNASNSVTLTMKLPKMIARDFEPHFSVKHMLKDVEIASRLARSYGISLEATDAARRSLLEEMRHNRGDSDFTSLMRVVIPLTKDEQEPEIRVSDHPMLDLRDAGPREDKMAEPPGAGATKSAEVELKLAEDKAAEATDVNAVLPTPEPSPPGAEAKAEPESEITTPSSEERIEPEVRLLLKEQTERPPEVSSEPAGELDNGVWSAPAFESPADLIEAAQDSSEAAVAKAENESAEQPPIVEPKLDVLPEEKIEPPPEMETEQLSEPTRERAQDVPESATVKTETDSAVQLPVKSAEPAEIAEPFAMSEVADVPIGPSQDTEEKAIEHDQVSLGPKSEPEVDHLVLNESASIQGSGGERRSLKEMWNDDGTADLIAEEAGDTPVTGETAAETPSANAAARVSEEKMEPEEKPEEVRRGFFSRLFSKTSNEKDPDY